MSLTLLSWVGALSHCSSSSHHQQCPLPSSLSPSLLHTHPALKEVRAPIPVPLPLALRMSGGGMAATAKRCYLQFEVEAPRISEDKSVAIVGNHMLLGVWDPLQAILMHKDPSRETAGSEIWVLRMDLPAGHKFEYKYVITNDPQRRQQYRQNSIPRINIEVLWETDIPNRVVTTVDDGKLHLISNVFNVASSFNELQAPEVSILPLTYGSKDGVARRSRSAQLEDAVGEEAVLIALVEEVYRDSPAEDAGLRPGQGILSIGSVNGAHVVEHGMGAILQEVREHKGKELLVKVVREDGQRVDDLLVRPRTWAGEGLLGCKMGACIPDPFEDEPPLLSSHPTSLSPSRAPSPLAASHLRASSQRQEPPDSSSQWPLMAKRQREGSERKQPDRKSVV